MSERPQKMSRESGCERLLKLEIGQEEKDMRKEKRGTGGDGEKEGDVLRKNREKEQKSLRTKRTKGGGKGERQEAEIFDCNAFLWSFIQGS